MARSDPPFHLFRLRLKELRSVQAASLIHAALSMAFSIAAMLFSSK
jgi:hypothetical protein